MKYSSFSGLMVLALIAFSPVTSTAQGLTQVSVKYNGGDVTSAHYASISADGRYVAFHSIDGEIVPGDTNDVYDVFVHDVRTRTTERVSVSSSGFQGDADSHHPSISADGRYVAFVSGASNFTSLDTDGFEVYVHDRLTGRTEFISREQDGHCHFPGISADGWLVTFVCRYGYNSPSGNAYDDVFVYDRFSGRTEWVSRTLSGQELNGGCWTPRISANGRHVAFGSRASNLVFGDQNSTVDIFVRSFDHAQTSMASFRLNGLQHYGISENPSISGDGRYVAYQVINYLEEVYLYDRDTRTTSLVSVADDGGPADNDAREPAISADGRYVAFCSTARNIGGGSDGGEYLYVRDREEGSTIRVPHRRFCNNPSISADGRYVAFQGDNNQIWSVDMKELRSQGKLRSPVFTKYNTFLRQWNFLELTANGTARVEATVRVYLLDGRELASQPVGLNPETQFDVDINGMIASACAIPNRCAGFSDIDGNGVIDTYGLVKIEFNDKTPGVSLIGRMSNYRQDPHGGTYSFAFSKELRNPTEGTTFATANTYDPQGMGYLVPNWLELINLSPSIQTFDYTLYNGDGHPVVSKTVWVMPFGEQDIPAGHDVLNNLGQVQQGVYLAEIRPHDQTAPYFATVSRYSSNSPPGVEPDTYNFGFGLDARAGKGAPLFATISNKIGGCYFQTNWVEIANVLSRPVTVSVNFRGPWGNLIGGANQVINPHAQYHLNGGALLAKGEVGSVEIEADQQGAVIAESMVYYHDCQANKVQTAAATVARPAGQVLQTGSVNTFLGMTDELRVIATKNGAIGATAEISSFRQIGPASSQWIDLGNFSTSAVSIHQSGTMSLPADTYGTLRIRSEVPGEFTAEVLRLRERADGRMDFVMPTEVR